MPRLSIPIPTSNKFDYIVEINLRRFAVLTYPRVKYIAGVSKQS